MNPQKSKSKYKWLSLCWFLLICIMALLTGCSVQDVENTEDVEWTGNPFDSEMLNHETVQYAYGFGLNVPDADTNMVYSGESIQAEYFVDNLGDEMSVGMLMFVDGVPQMYAVNGGEPTYLHIQKVSAYEKVTVPISFTPVKGNNGEISSVRFLSILNPDLRPDKKEYVFGHTGAMTTFLPRFIEMQQSVSAQPEVYPQMNAQRDMTAEEVAQVIYVDRRGRTIDRMNSFNLIVSNPEDVELACLPVENNILTFEVQGYGGNAGSYLLMPFVNHLPVQADGFPGILTVETGEKIYEGSLSLDISLLDAEYYGIEKYNTFYMMAIPLDGDPMLDPVQSASFVFVGE